MFNCLYNGNGYGIGLHSQAQVLAECNFFDKVKNPIRQMYREDPKSPHHGFFGAVDNIFRDCEGQRAIEGTTFAPKTHYRYEFAVNAATDVPKVVKAGVGPAEAFGTITPLSARDHGAINVGVASKLRWTPAPGATGYEVAFAETNPPKPAGKATGQTFDPGELTPGTLYYWRVDSVTPEGTVNGETWRFRTASKNE